MRRQFKVGLHLPETERVVPWSEIADICRQAEAVGFDSIWMPDHLIYRDDAGIATGPWECWSMLAAVAAITERVEIGPLVLCTSFRNPAIIAKMADTVDEISGGRLILGLGAGWNQVEYDAYGFEYASRFGRFREAFTIIQTLLTQGWIDFEGRYYAARDCELHPRGPRPQGPPLMIGSRGAQVLRSTLPNVEYWNAWPRWWANAPNRLPALLAEVDAAANDSGANLEKLVKTTAVYVRVPGGDDHDDPETPHFAGSSEEIVTFLLRCRDTGIDHIQVVLDPISVAGVLAFAPVLEELDTMGIR